MELWHIIFMGKAKILCHGKKRLRIALETEWAIAYLHNAPSMLVFHRDIKSANIPLTDALTAKVSDFGASRSTSIDDTDTYNRPRKLMATLILNTFIIVYSFGVIELLMKLTSLITQSYKLSFTVRITGEK